MALRTFLKVQLQKMIHSTYPCYSANDQRMSYYQMLLQSVRTKCRVQRTAHRRCWTVVSRLDSTDKYFCTHDENQTKISQELLVQYLGQLHAKSQLQVSIVLQQNWSEESKSSFDSIFFLGPIGLCSYKNVLVIWEHSR